DLKSTINLYGSPTAIYTVPVLGIFVLRDSGASNASQRLSRGLITLNLYRKQSLHFINSTIPQTKSSFFISLCLFYGMNSSHLSIPIMPTGLEHNLIAQITSPACLMSCTEQ